MDGKLIIYVDMDFTLCDFKKSYDQVLQSNPEIKYPQSVPGFFRGLEPIPDAINTYRWLNKQERFSVFILTAPSIKNPLCYTEKRLWVEDHLGIKAVDGLIISPHKGLNKGDYLIDDNVQGKGQEFFEGHLIEFGSTHYPDWVSIKQFFDKL